MPRKKKKKKDYKLKDLKGEIVKLMKMNGITQTDLGKALNLSQSRICEMLKMEGKNVKVLTIGKKSQEFFAKRGFSSIGDYPGLAESLRIAETHKIVDQFLELYRKQEIDKIFLCYTEFVSPLTQEAHCIQLLPSDFKKSDAETGKKPAATEYDPSPEAVFESIIPEYLYGVLYGAVVESYASEQSARRMAMESASDNASEMIEDLNLSYNRARQAAITQEITEIVAGSGEVGS